MTTTFQEYILACIGRVNWLAASEQSYDRNTHEACINDIWLSIPRSKKEGWLEEWAELDERFSPWDKSGSPDDQKRRAVARIEGKRQLLSEVLFDLGQLFEAGDMYIKRLFEKGR